MRKILLILLLLLVSLSYVYAQNSKIIYSNPLNSSVILSLNGGSTYILSDYNNPRFGDSYNLSLAYFFPSYNRVAYGLYVTGSKEKYVGELNYLGFPESFKTKSNKIGGGLSVSFALSNSILPNLKLGISYHWLEFSNPGTVSKIFNISSDDLKKSIVFDIEPELNIKISRVVGLQISSGVHFVANDNFDAVRFGNHNDFFISGKIGISFTLFSNSDFDNDGIIDSEDGCIDLPEDIDGFEDYDGCPDYDNDNDGIPDKEDKCPFTKEDFDNFEDNDGCPEVDNDKDGILDAQDKCPDLPEDFDGFEDYDGCPDYDNDGDSIPDSVDQCPDAAEIINNYKDDDGCPDVVPVEKIIKKKKDNSRTEKTKRETLPNVFVLHSETTFEGETGIIKSAAMSKLNKIANLIKQYPRSKWRIEGHIDSRENQLEAIKITQRQAEAIMLYLVSKGLPRKNFIAIGMGDSVPIASNKLAYGRLKNRRIKIVRIK